jgi:cytochrome c556
MRRVAMYVTALTLTLAGSTLVAQVVTAPEQLDATMKRVAAGFGGANKAVMSMAYDDARKQLAAARAAIVDAENLWVTRKKDDAVKFSKDVQAGIDAVDKLLAAAPVDQMAVTAAMKQAGAGCAGCHMAYRERDANMNWVIKPGTF